MDIKSCRSVCLIEGGAELHTHTGRAENMKPAEGVKQ